MTSEPMLKKSEISFFKIKFRSKDFREFITFKIM